jgi:hypothetical protein
MNQETRRIAPGPLTTKGLPPVWMDSLLGLLVGFGGGLLCKAALGSWTPRNLVLASLFGLIFGLFFSKRAASPGAGLIWGLGFAFLVWITIPAGLGHFFSRYGHAGNMFGDAQEHFPDLVAYLVCLGMPVGLLLGVRGAFRGKTEQRAFSWGRAIVVGGFSGLLGGMIFGRWMSAGDFFPLLAGLGVIHSHEMTVALHFGIAILIGATFGLLFQRDVRGYGSSMGWGLGYGIFWWFFGPLTVLPILAGTGLDWSADRGTAMFGSVVGHILYGLILGVAYATVDRLWIQLFIQSDPLNREPEGPGLRLFRSLRWGAFAGLMGGLVGCRTRKSSFRLSRFPGSHLRQRGNRNDLRSSFSPRSFYFGTRSDVGMAVRAHLVVHRTDDTLASAFDRRMRLESQRGFGAAAVFEWTFDFWCNHRSDLPRARKTLHTRSVLGSSYRGSRIAPNPPRGNACTCVVASHPWAGSLTTHSLGVMPPSGYWSVGDFNCRANGKRHSVVAWATAHPETINVVTGRPFQLRLGPPILTVCSVSPTVSC